MIVYIYVSYNWNIEKTSMNLNISAEVIRKSDEIKCRYPSQIKVHPPSEK